MSVDIRKVRDMNGLIAYFAETLNWRIDLDDFDDIEDIAYDFEAEDIGLKEEAFAKIKSLRQLPPLVDGQKWGIFCVEFDSRKFEVTALRKILSGLIPKRRNSADHAVWSQQDLLFICFWGEDNDRTIGVAHFEDMESGLPQIKMISCAPALEDFTQIKTFEDRLKSLKWPMNYVDHEKWQADWASAFTTGYKQTIRDASTLTIQLAIEAQGIRNRILDILEVESPNGYVHLLFEKFRNTLIHDITETQFADMYAQTVVYGLFSARCMDETQDDFSAAEAVECIPNTNPFLKHLMKECLGAENTGKLSFDELEIGNVVDLLMHTKTDAIIADFNRQTGGGREDPVIHFYEEFLTAYDKMQKVQRGVYYTPQPVVNFIVRAVDTIIKQGFGLEDGLASTETKTIKIMRQSKRRVGYYYTQVEDSEEVPAIQVLDPATGTGTFIRQTILQIYENFKEKNKGLSADDLKKAWNAYVPVHLLPRINAFELMMAPYAVAHMKLAMILRDTGYEFGSENRLNVYLTNSLEEPGNSDGQLTLWSDPLATESISANAVKKNEGINVIIGNPPYSGESANKGSWIMGLMEDYKKEPGGEIKLQEKNPKWLNDDYVKFIRYAQHFATKAGAGIIAYICPHGFLTNPTFRGMRWNLYKEFSKLYVVDLHGNSRKKEVCADGSKDENVFDIQQGVCILIAVKERKSSRSCDVYRYDIQGTREKKYEWLNNATMESIAWSTIDVDKKSYIFDIRDLSSAGVYETGFSVKDAFVVNSMGVTTGCDSILVDAQKEALERRIERLRDKQVDDQVIADEFFGGKSQGVASMRACLMKSDPTACIRKVCYRPFDNRFLYYYPNALARPRVEVMKHLSNGRNLALCIIKVNRDIHFLPYVTNEITDKTLLSSKDNANVFPLFLFNDQSFGEQIVPNFNHQFLREFEDKLGLQFKVEGAEVDSAFTATDLFDYILCVLYSPSYNNRFSDLLMSDFPRIPYPESKAMFWGFVKLGQLLREKCLMRSKQDKSRYFFSGDGNCRVEKAFFSNRTIFINKAQGFYEVSEELWNAFIAGYQPLQKWMKDRKGLVLSAADISHYCFMIETIEDIIEIMKQIDALKQF